MRPDQAKTSSRGLDLDGNVIWIELDGHRYHPEDFKRAYNGKSSSFCMCGCNGNYTDKAKSLSTFRRSWNKIASLLNEKDVEVFGEPGDYLGIDYLSDINGKPKGCYLYAE
jgi:hypothetical protein